MLLGSFSSFGNNIQITCRMVSVETGEIVYAASTRGVSDNIFEVQAELVKKIERFASKADSVQ